MKIINKGPAVLIAPEAEQRIRHWVDLARGEVSGLGTVIPHDDGLSVQEVYLLEQQCSGSHTELDDGAVAALLVNLDAKGVDTGAVRFWWHSHGTMQSFWSATDDSCIEGLANDNYMVSLVTNQHRQDRVRIDQYTPLRLTVDEVPLRLHHQDLGLWDECEKEFREKVEEITLMVRHGRRTRGRSGRQDDKWTPVALTDPPWPHDIQDQDDGHLLEDPDDDRWDDGWDRDWDLHDDNSLAHQLTDPWGCALALGVR